MIVNENCPCKRTKCERHGNCAECREHHITDKKSPVYCERIKVKQERKAKRAERKRK